MGRHDRISPVGRPWQRWAAVGLLLACTAAGADTLILNRRWLGPVHFQAEMGIRSEWCWRYRGPADGGLRQARVFQGENLWGDNILRVAMEDRNHTWAGKQASASVGGWDADGRQVHAREAIPVALLPAGGGTPRPGVFGQLAALGVQRHYEGNLNTDNHVQAFIPYRMAATSFPARIGLRLRDPATGAELGAWTQTFPALGYVRLHVARCNPFADDAGVPAFLRIRLDETSLPAARVQVRVVHEATGRVVRREDLPAFETRDLGFDLNLAGLGAGRYRVEADLRGPGGLRDLSAVWLEVREPPAGGRTDVPLLVEEMPDFSRSNWPVTGGIPLPDGALPAAALDRCRILDAAGEALAAQFRVLATWAADRRFARWLLVDFQADSRNGQCGPFTLAILPEAAAAPGVSPAIRVTAQGDGFRVDTGPLQADFLDRQGRFLQQVFVLPPGEGARERGRALLDPARSVSAYMTLLPIGAETGGGAVETESVLSPDIRCELEETGPLRCVVKASGTYGRPGADPVNAFVLRFTFWAGRPEIGVEHTFVWEKDPKRYLIRDFGLRWPIAGVRGVTAPSGASPSGISTNVAAYPLPWTVLQEGSRTNRFVGRTLAGRFPGWADATLDAGGIGVRIGDFWQQHPCGLAVDAGSIDLQFWPAAYAPLDLRNQRETYYRGNARGVAKTHRAVLAPHAEVWTAQAAAAWAAQQEEPLRVTAHPLAVLKSRAVGPLHPYDPTRFPDEEKALDNCFRGMELQPSRTDVYGCMDWGDLHSKWDRAKGRWDPDYRYWLNNETTYDASTISLWMQYLRTGKRGYFAFPERRTTHLMDVDTCHHSVNQPPHFDGHDPANNVQVVGLQHRHAEHHWNGACMAHHTIYDDIVAYYHLTGRQRALDVLGEAAASFKTYRPGAENENRGISVPFRLLGDLYWQLWDFDHWRLAAELHDLLSTYSLPDLYGQYGYLRYWVMTGDRRYALEWMRAQMIHGNALPKVDAYDFLRKRIEWDDTVNYPDPSSAAIMHEITGDPQALTRMEQLNFLGPYYSGPGSGKIPVGIEMPLLSCFPSDGGHLTPPGYDWPHMAAFKYAFAMQGIFQTTSALAEPGPLPPRRLDPPLHTNGGGGGRWSDVATFAEGRIPGPATPVVVNDHDKLVFDIDGRGPHAAGLALGNCATLAFAPGTRTLVIRGDIQVGASAKVCLSPGAGLKVECPDHSGQYGITLAGRIEAEGTSPNRRDCALGAATPGGRNDTYLRAPRGDRGQSDCSFLRNCELEGIDIALDGRRFALAGNRLRHVRLRAQNIPGLELHSNTLHNCALRLDTGTDFVGNRIDGGYARIATLRCHGNRFEHVAWGLWLSGNTFADNTYLGCGDITLSGSAARLERERFDGNRTGLRIATQGPVTLDHCDFGRTQPNIDGDLIAGAAAVELLSCRFSPEIRIRIDKAGSVRSTDHDGVPGATRTWGKAATSIVAPSL